MHFYLQGSAIADSPPSPAKVAPVIVEFVGVESGLSKDMVYRTLFGADGVSERYQVLSKGHFALTPWSTKQPVIGPIVVERRQGETCDGSYRIWTERVTQYLGKLGEKIENVDNLMFFFPPAELLGCTTRARGELLGFRSWIFAYDTNTIIHEIGHNLGLAHASTGDFTSTFNEYGDISTPMGYLVRDRLLLNAPEMKQLGWLSAASIQQLSIPGSYDVEISSLESLESSLPAAVQINIPGAAFPVLISFRNLLHPDYPGLRDFTRGVSIHIDQGFASKTILTETLVDGAQFFESTLGLRIAQVSHTSDSALVRIVFPSSEFTPLTLTPVNPAHDSDGDGIPNDLDCAPNDGNTWSNLISIDADQDGIPDSTTSIGNCFGENLPTGYAFIENKKDNCVDLSSADTRDSNWDGIGDACTLDLDKSNKKYLQEAALRQFVNMNSRPFDKYGNNSEKQVIKLLKKLLKTASSGPVSLKDLKKAQKKYRDNILAGSSKNDDLRKELQKTVKKFMTKKGFSNIAPTLY